MKNKLKVHNYAILNYKYSANKITNQCKYISVQSDQRVKNDVYLFSSYEKRVIIPLMYELSHIILKIFSFTLSKK